MKSSPARTSLPHPSSNYRSFPGPERRLFTRLFRYIDLSIPLPAAARKRRTGESEKETDSTDEVQQKEAGDVRRTKHKNEKKKKKTATRKKDVREEETHGDDS